MRAIPTVALLALLPGLMPAADKLLTEDRVEIMRGMMAEPDVQKRLAEIGFEAKWTEPKVFKDELAADIALWAKLTKEAGIEPQ